MNSPVDGRRLVAVLGGAGLIGLGLLTSACGTESKESPTTTTTTTTTTTAETTPAETTATPAPTEKDLNPTGGNLFTPGDKAPPAGTVAPGQHHGINGVP